MPSGGAMLKAEQIEQLIDRVSTLDRDDLKTCFSNYRGNFPVDFTNEFLDRLPVERMRHIFVALCLQSQYIPDLATT
jgi:hypothetical protein